MGTPSLKLNLAGIPMKNPVMTASGTFGYGIEFSSLIDLNRLGGIVVKGLSLTPAPGNPPPRTVETCGGMLNAIGLENIGLDAFIEKKWPFLEKVKAAVFLNIYGRQMDEYGRIAERVHDLKGIAGVEVNISCPNVKAGGLAFGTDPRMAAQVTRTVRENTTLPLIVKLSPNVTDIVSIAKSVQDAGADAVSLINTVTGMAVDVKKRRPKLANVIGGLSGPAIKPIALRMVWQVARAVHIPVIGIGGIMNTSDALEFLIAGATAIQIGTANFVDPKTSIRIVDGLSDYLAENNISDINEIIGSLKTS